VELQLTPAGRETIEGLIPPVVEKLNFALTEFTVAEVLELRRLLVKLNTRLQSTVSAAKTPASAEI
jgi:DNA-binding MarR family transcriptional regulator